MHHDGMENDIARDVEEGAGTNGVCPHTLQREHLTTMLLMTAGGNLLGITARTSSSAGLAFWFCNKRPHAL